LGLAAARGLLSADQIERLERASTARDQLSVSQARVLLAVCRKQVDGKWLRDSSEDEKLGLARLQRLGWIEPERGGFRLAEDTAANLGIAGG
jgi:hypothetical protein